MTTTPTPQQPGQMHPAPPSGYYPPPAQKKQRRWPWIVGAIVALLFIIGLFADDPQPAAPAAPEQPAPAAAPVAPPAPAPVAPPAAAPVAPVPIPVVLPEVAGRNGQIVWEQLTDLGLTNFTMASRDTEDKLVLFPANWTAVSIEPGPGETVMSDDTVIVTMTKE